MHKVGIIGITGKLGRLLKEHIHPEEFQLVLRANSTYWEETERPDILINISAPGSNSKVLDYCVDNHISLIEGTSGIGEDYLSELKKYSKDIAILRAENFSYGHYLQSLLVNYLTGLLSETNDYQLSITERHCIDKKDAPSATAKKLASICEQNNLKKITINAVRGGLPVSDHELHLATQYEELIIKHDVRNRMAAIEGIIKAIRWLIPQQKGFWTMENVYKNKIYTHESN